MILNEIIRLLWLNLTFGTTMIVDEGISKEEIVYLLMITLGSLAFSLSLLYLWNLTLLGSQLTIIMEVQYVYEKIFPIILPFVF